MLSVDQCRALLDGQNLSDEEIEFVRDALYESAQLAFEVFWQEKYGSKNPVGLLHNIAQKSKD